MSGRVDSNGNPLPKCMHHKCGRYYLVIQNKWHSLSRDYKEALSQAESRLEDMEKYDGMESYLRKLYTISKNNAKGHGKHRKEKPFALPDAEFVVELAVKQKMRCAVTNARFDLAVDPVSKRRPLAPSIDRIDCNGGYTKDNIRLVCQITNIAISNWGEEYLLKIAKPYVNSIRSSNMAASS